MSEYIILGVQLVAVFVLGSVIGTVVTEWLMKPKRDAKGRFTCSKKGRK